MKGMKGIGRSQMHVKDFRRQSRVAVVGGYITFVCRYSETLRIGKDGSVPDNPMAGYLSAFISSPIPITNAVYLNGYGYVSPSQLPMGIYSWVLVSRESKCLAIGLLCR